MIPLTQKQLQINLATDDKDRQMLKCFLTFLNPYIIDNEHIPTLNTLTTANIDSIKMTQESYREFLANSKPSF